MSVTLSPAVLPQAMSRLWVVMAEMYGSAWAKEYGDTPSPAWTAAVGELSGSQVKHGIEACKSSGDQYPPRLPVFIQRCRAARERPAPSKALPAPNKPSEGLQQAAHALSTSHKAQRTDATRSVRRPDEGPAAYSAAVSRARLAGKTMYEFKWERLLENGWTKEMEHALYENARGCGYSLYGGTTNLMIDCNE